MVCMEVKDEVNLLNTMNTWFISIYWRKTVEIDDQISDETHRHWRKLSLFYVIKFVSDVPPVGGFLRTLQFPPPKKMTVTIELKYCWKWRYKRHNTNPILLVIQGTVINTQFMGFFLFRNSYFLIPVINLR